MKGTGGVGWGVGWEEKLLYVTLREIDRVSV
jgi:hypothetical protein